MDMHNLLNYLSNLMDLGLSGHHSRVTLYSKQIASVICPDLINEVILAASIHDIGKIGIPDEILLKPGPLARNEWELVRLHPLIGAQILQRSINDKINREIIAAVMHHHERWDGLGYPCGLKGKDIPFLSRILAVADSFDAMTSFRPYKTSLGREEALKELQKHSGSQFDPEMADVFLRIMQGGDKNAGDNEPHRCAKEGGVSGKMDEVFERIKRYAASGNLKEIFALLAGAQDPAVREAAYVQVIRLKSPEVVENFISLLSSSEAHLRNLAVEGLQELGAGYIDHLEKLLCDPDPDLKILCFNILAGVKSEAAADPVRRFLERVAATGEKEQENVLAAALECMGELGGPGDAALLDKVAALIERGGGHPYLIYTMKQAKVKLWAI
ncbi:MAG: HD domain-containing phosphohydrolase [Bacillota bacterium]